MMAFIEINYPIQLTEITDMEKIILDEFQQSVRRCAPRFKNSRKGKIWSTFHISDRTLSPRYILSRYLLPITEWEGNYRRCIHGWIKKHFTLRYNTPKRIKKQERIRGYRDHGSMSSNSERARRVANTSPIRGVRQDGYIVDWELYHSSLQFKKQQKKE